MKFDELKIGDCCEVTSSKRIFYSEYVQTGVPFYRSKEIIQSFNGQSIDEPLYIAEEKYEQILERFGVPVAGDMLLTSVGTIGVPYIVKDTDHFYFKDGNLTWFRNFNNKLSSKYLYYWIQSPQGKGIINNSTIGSSQKALTISMLKGISLSLPSLQTQCCITNILSAYDDLIENNQKQIKLLEEAAMRLYKEWFVHLRFPGHETTKIVDGVPEGWRLGKLEELIEVKYGKDHKKVADGDIPVYGSGGLMRKCNRFLHDGESVLIPRKGSLNNIMYVNERFWTVDTMFFTQMKCNNIALYIYFFMCSFDMYSMNIGAAVPSMTTSTLNGLDVLIPEETLLESFDNSVKICFLRVAVLKNQNEKAKFARDKLLPKLMSGEIEM